MAAAPSMTGRPGSDDDEELVKEPSSKTLDAVALSRMIA